MEPELKSSISPGSDVMSVCCI